MVRTSKEKRSLIKHLKGESNLLMKAKYNISNNIGIQRIILALIFIIILIVLTTPKFISEIKIKGVGEVADSDIISPVKFPVYKDKNTYEEEKSKILMKVRPYYYIDEEITKIALSQIKPFFESANNIIKNNGLSYAINSQGMQLPPSTWYLIADKERRGKLEENISILTMKIMERGIIKDSDVLIERGVEEITIRDVNGEEKDVGVEKVISRNSVETIIIIEGEKLIPTDENLRESSILITKMMIKPNLIEDKSLTNERVRNALSQINPVEYWVLEGEVIITAHTRITEEQIKVIEALNDNLTSGRIVLIWIGKSFLILILTGILGIYIYYFHRRVFEKTKSLIVISAIFLSVIGIGKLLIHVFSAQLPQSGLLFPAAAISILLTLLFNMEIGLVSALFSGLIAGILCGFDITVALVTIIGSSVGAIAVNTIKHKRIILFTGMMILISTLLIILGTSLVSLSPIRDIFYELGWGSAGAIISISLVGVLLVPVEHIFNISSKIRLMKFSDLNSSMLRKFASRAPGTYHHSIQVSIIAEECASAINRNQILCRVGGYYHDIGKMLTPEFFIENQEISDNPHESLTPHFSAMLIKKHIKDGIDIAREYKLPDPIIDIIKEHHGTSRISFFYQKALQENDGKLIDEKEYRYSGPKPTSKESAIIMMCDACESAIRSLATPNKSNIRNTVGSIIENRLEDGQFEDCDITLREIEIIKRTMIRELSNIYHMRISYDEDEENGKETERVITDADTSPYRIFPRRD